MKEYYDILINGIEEGTSVTDIVRGEAWIGAELSNGGFGIAMNTECESIGRSFDTLIGLDAKEAARAVMSWNLNEASEGMAVINAYYNTKQRMEKQGFNVEYSRSCTAGIDTVGKTVALIGHLKLRKEELEGAKQVYIIERDPRENDYPDSACEYILPECDIVIITGSAAINKTMPRLLELSENAITIVIGPSVPMCPELKKLGIDRLSGMVTTNKTGLIEWMKEVKGNPYPFGETFMIG